jgi:hypothetical protein
LEKTELRKLDCLIILMKKGNAKAKYNSKSSKIGYACPPFQELLKFNVILLVASQDKFCRGKNM